MNTNAPEFIYNSLYNNLWIPTIPYSKHIPKLFEDKNLKKSHTIYYLENIDTFLLKTNSYLPVKDFLISSAREQSHFKEYCYFLLFTQLNHQSHRYGLYFKSIGHSLLELKVTLYVHNHHPLYIKIYNQQDKSMLVEQYCFNHINFIFYLDWLKIKNTGIIIQLQFIHKYEYSFKIEFENILI